MEAEGAMNITLKLFATLSRHLPAGTERNVARIEVSEGTTVGALLDDLGVPREAVHMVLVNGRHVPVEEVDSTPLEDGTTLAVWPPVAGG